MFSKFGDAEPAITAALLAVVNPAAILGVTQEAMQQPQQLGCKRQL